VGLARLVNPLLGSLVTSSTAGSLVMYETLELYLLYVVAFLGYINLL